MLTSNKGFFDNINHEWLMNNVPLSPILNPVMKEWLKAGCVHEGKYSLTVSGTPQGGIISPI